LFQPLSQTVRFIGSPCTLHRLLPSNHNIAYRDSDKGAVLRTCTLALHGCFRVRRWQLNTDRPAVLYTHPVRL